MRIAIIGATGTIGRALGERLAPDHEVMALSRSSIPAVDMAEPASLARFLAGAPKLDAVICCAASVPLAAIETMTPEKLAETLRAKLLGQVELTRLAALHLADHGVLVLTAGRFSGFLTGAGIGALANRGLEAFVEMVAPEMPRGIRVNVVSPGWITETLVGLGLPPDGGTPVAMVVEAYHTALVGGMTGEVLLPSRDRA